MVEPTKGFVTGDNQGDSSGDLALRVVDSRSGDVVLNVEDSGEKEAVFELTETEMEETGFVSGDNHGDSSGDLALRVVDSRSGDVVLNVEDSGEKEAVFELTETEMEEALNGNQGITVANLLLSKGFTLEEQESGRYALFGPNSRDSLIEFDREEDYHRCYNKLSIRDVIHRYPEYANLLGGVVCEATDCSGKGKGKGKRELVPQVKGKGRKRMVCDTCQQAIVKRRERGKKGQAQKKGPLAASSTSVRVTPEIRSSQAIAQMANAWLKEKADISSNIEKRKQMIQKCLDSIQHHNDSIEKNQRSLLHFEAKVVEALTVVNETTKAIIVSSVNEYNNLKPYLRAEVQVFCPEKNSRKDELECAVTMDNRAFFTF